MTQSNLGNALRELGIRSAGEEGRKLLEEAVGVYSSALEVYTEADLPQDWAMTQNNLGKATRTCRPATGCRTLRRPSRLTRGRCGFTLRRTSR